MSHEFLNSRSSRVSSILGLGFEIKFNPLNQTQMSEKEIALLFYLLFFWQWKCFIAQQIKQRYCKRAREGFFYSCDYRSINTDSPKTQAENSNYIQRTLVLVSNPRDIGFAWSCGRWKFKTDAKHYFSCRVCSWVLTWAGFFVVSKRVNHWVGQCYTQSQLLRIYWGCFGVILTLIQFWRDGFITSPIPPLTTSSILQLSLSKSSPTFILI